MANFASLDLLLDTTVGMEVLRNNVKQDDGTDTITGVSWFKFNNVVAASLYASGNSWIGFGAALEQLKVWRRDTAMFYLYRQEGTIGSTKFLKIRWEGYSHYSTTDVSDALKYEVFLFEDGGLYLNFITVPDSSYVGTNQLVCVSNAYSFSVSASTPIEYSFYPQDATGSTWLVAQERYPVHGSYVSSGNAVYTFSEINAANVVMSELSWTEDIPEGTELEVSVSTDGVTYTPIGNHSEIVSSGEALTSLYIKVEMSTTDVTVTPSLSELFVLVQDADDVYSIILDMVPKKRFCSSAGQISIVYNAEIGNLAGICGPVDSFNVTFSPEDLISKPHQNPQEHLEITNITADGDLIRIYYSDTKCDERLEIASITAVGTLTNINDI